MWCSVLCDIFLVQKQIHTSWFCVFSYEPIGLISNLLGLMINLPLFTLHTSCYSRACYDLLYTPMNQRGRKQSERKPGKIEM